MLTARGFGPRRSDEAGGAERVIAATSHRGAPLTSPALRALDARLPALTDFAPRTHAHSNPADLAMVRMQADGRLPAELRRNYRNAGDALYRVAREEGVLALWRGSVPTASRACIITAAQFSVYEECKEQLIERTPLGDTPFTHGLASFACAIVAGIISNPFDVAKTRLMNMKIEADGSRPYKNTFHAIIKTASEEGVLALMKGLGPTVARQVPLNLVRFMTVEQLRKIF